MSDLETLLAASVEIIELKRRIAELESALQTIGNELDLYGAPGPAGDAFRALLRPTFDEPDDAPYCQYCGAKRKKDCDCGPIAENN